MKTKHLLFSTLCSVILGLGFIACDEDTPTDDDVLDIYFSISDFAATQGFSTKSERTGDYYLNMYVFDSHGKVVLVSNGIAEVATNTDSSKPSLELPLLFVYGGNALTTFSQPYAYHSSELEPPYTLGPGYYSVATDQISSLDYFASDIMFGEFIGESNTPLPNQVHITLTHLLSRIAIAITPSADVDANDLADAVLYINNVQTDYDYSVSFGQTPSITARGDRRSILTTCEWSTAEKMIANDVIVVPQNLSAGTKLIRLVLNNGRELVYRLPQDLSLKGGHQYLFNLLFSDDSSVLLAK